MVVTLPRRRAMGFGKPMTAAELDAWADKVVASFSRRLPGLERVSGAARSRRVFWPRLAASPAWPCCAGGGGPAFAWGDEGHEVIGLIADHYLEPAVRKRVQAMLAGDATGLTAKDIAHEAAWADKYRDSDRNTTKVRYEQTRNWHFVDLELAGADLEYAPASAGRHLAPGTPASLGPAQRLRDRQDR